MIGKIYNQKINSDVSNLTNLALCFFFFLVKSLFSFSLLQFVYLFILLFFFNVQILYGLRSVFWLNIIKNGTVRTSKTGHGS